MRVFLCHSILALTPFSLDVTRPWALLGLALLIPAAYWAYSTRVSAARWREVAATVLRLTALAALVGAIAGTRMVRTSDTLCVTLLVDQSKSIDPDARAAELARLRTALGAMADNQRLAVIGFGGESVLQQLPGRNADLPPMQGRFRRDFTDIARAMRLALSIAPQDAANRIVLLSDGVDTSGADAVLDAAASARATGTPVDVRTLGAASAGDVWIEPLILDSQVDANQPLAVKAVIHSDVARRARISMRSRGRWIDLSGSGDHHYRTVSLQPGANPILISEQRIGQGGFYDFEVTVEPVGGDRTASNNTAMGVTRVLGAPGVLIVDDSPKGRQGDNLRAALRAASIEADLVGVAGFPASLMEFNRYEAVVLSDVPADALGVEQMKLAQRWIQTGGGFVWVGGANSFGPGGYAGTPLEAASPVSCDVKRYIERASLALAVAIDQSGSMGMPVHHGATKMDLANNAAAEAVKLLDARDEAGIVMVDTAYKWITSPAIQRMTAGRKKNLIASVLANQPGGGGIYCHTALQASLKALAATHTTSKHVLLFADAADCEQQGGCLNMIRKAHASGVTFSAVGLGLPTDPHARFLRQVADTGGGRFYITADAAKLPRMFIRDVSMAARNAFIEPREGIAPAIVTLPGAGEAGVDPILRGVSAPPRLKGQVATTIKSRAAMLMHGPKADDPLLAKWRYGLGKAVAWTSDARGHWAGSWVSWDRFSKFWSQVVRWAMRNTNLDSPVTAWAGVRGSKGVITADAIDAGGEPITDMTLHAVVESADPTAAPRTVELRQTAPGRYAGRFEARDVGAYIVNVVDAEGRSLDAAGTVMSYSPEFSRLESDQALMTQVASISGGRELDDLTNLFVRPAGKAYTYKPIAMALLIAALGLFFADIVVRRFVLPERILRWLTPARRHEVDARAAGRLRHNQTARRKTRPAPAALDPAARDQAAQMLTTPEPTDDDEAASTRTADPKTAPAAPVETGGGMAERLRAAKQRARQEMLDKSQQD